MHRPLHRSSLVLTLFALAFIIYSNSSGSFSSDYTGSPLSSQTCQNCHGSTSGSGSVSMNIPDFYYPGGTYSVDLTVSASTAEYGFMAGVLRDNNANGGTFVSSSGTATTTISSRSYIKHNTPSTSSSWSFGWTAPSYADTIIFYFVANAANGNNQTSGDVIYFGSDTIFPLPLITATKDTTGTTCPESCDGEASISNLQGGEGGPYTFEWSTNDTTSAISGLCAGTYSVTVTDANGNEQAFSFDVEAPDDIEVAFSSTGTSCVNAQGSASASVSGGTAPYSYLWNTSSTDSSITGLSIGWYLVTITDALGCTQVDSVEIVDEGSGLQADFSTQDENCNQGDGQISILPQNGTTPYQYAWSNGGVTSTLSNQASGIYTVTLTDNDGCADTFSDTIHEHFAVIDIGASSTENVACFGDSSGLVSLVVESGIEPLQYVWSTGDTGASVSNLPAGNYTVTLSDAEGCTDTAIFGVSEPDALALVSIVDSANEGFCDGSVLIQSSGGTPPYTYSWNPNVSTSNIATDLCDGVYQVNVTDANDCTSQLELLVGVKLGINSKFSESIEIYPIPTARMLNVRGLPRSETRLVMVNLLGSVVLDELVVHQEVRFDLASLPAGNYSLIIRNASSISRKQVVVE